MVLQLKGCIECLTMLHPEFDYLFLFDRLCRHYRQHEDGLNAGKMLKGHGEKLPKMRAMEITLVLTKPF